MGDVICLRCGEPSGEAHVCPVSAEDAWSLDRLAADAPLLPGHPRTQEGRDDVALGWWREGPDGKLALTAEPPPEEPEAPLAGPNFRCWAPGLGARVRPERAIGFGPTPDWSDRTAQAHTVPVLLRPITLPAWELHRSDLSPPARLLLAWTRDTGRDTRKGGGWLRRAWRRHGYVAPRDVVGEEIARLARALAPLVTACGEFAEALGHAFDGVDFGAAFAALERPPFKSLEVPDGE